jgi:hypothetical protein
VLQNTNYFLYHLFEQREKDVTMAASLEKKRVLENITEDNVRKR